MVKTFRDFDREKDKIIFKDEGKKEGRLELLLNMIKKGILSLKQAAEEMGMTVSQFKTAVKNLDIE